MLVTWELPDDAATISAWRRAHAFAPAELVGADEDLPILYARAEYARQLYPAALDALVAASIAGRALDRRSLYSTGLRYLRECCGEVWRVWPVPLWRGGGDCEDLAAARVAELRESGVPAFLELRASAQLDSVARLWHVLVRLPGGATEDPSRELGMGTRDVSCDPLGPRGRPCSGMMR